MTQPLDQVTNTKVDEKSNSLGNIVERINTILKQDFEWSEIDKVMVELHAKLTEPKWAIEDERVRDEYEKLFISYVVKSLRSSYEK